MHSIVARNTLISAAGLNKIILMPHEEELYTSLRTLLTKFQEIKTFASEIHTENTSDQTHAETSGICL